MTRQKRNPCLLCKCTFLFVRIAGFPIIIIHILLLSFNTMWWNTLWVYKKNILMQFFEIFFRKGWKLKKNLHEMACAYKFKSDFKTLTSFCLSYYSGVLLRVVLVKPSYLHRARCNIYKSAGSCIINSSPYLGATSAFKTGWGQTNPRSCCQQWLHLQQERV